MLKYNLDIELKACLTVTENGEQSAEQQAEILCEDLIEGSPLGKEGVDEADYDTYPVSKSELQRLVEFTYKFSTEVDFRLVEVGAPPLHLDEHIVPLLAGSLLAKEEWHATYTTSDNQPSLDALLEDIEANEPFCVQEPGARYHMECARERFGEEQVEEADVYQAGELTIIYGHEWESSVRNAFAHKEGIVDHCDSCMGTLYDEPKKQEEEAK